MTLFKKYVTHNTKVLDVGCGTGSWVTRLSELLGAKAMGIDVFDYHNNEYPFCIFDGYNVPFSDNSFDVGLLIHVLHHTDHHDRILSECKRVINGKLIIFEDIASSKLQNAFTKLNDFYGNKVRKFFRALKRQHSFNSLFIPMPYNYYTYGLWFSKFQKHGFKIDEMISLPYKTMEHGIFVLSSNK